MLVNLEHILEALHCLYEDMKLNLLMHDALPSLGRLLLVLAQVWVLCARLSLSLSLSLSECVCVFTHVYMHVYKYAYVYVCMHAHAHTHGGSRWSAHTYRRILKSALSSAIAQ